MKHILTTLTILLATIMAWANDGTYYTSGNQLIPLAETDIRVQKEILTISLADDGMAYVDVYYEFYNPSRSAKTVLMGFEANPSYNDDYKFYTDAKHKHIKNFTVEMNGQAIAHKNAVSADDKFEPLNTDLWEIDETNLALTNKTNPDITLYEYSYVYYFDATFQPGVNKVHHTYAYTMSVIVGTTFQITYKLSPASRWAGGKIGDFTLVVRADNTAKHFLVEQSALPGMKPAVTQGIGKMRTTQHYDTKYWEVSLRNGAITFHRANFSPKAGNELLICSADQYTSFNDEAQFGSFYDRCSNTELYTWHQKIQDSETTIDPQWIKRIARNLPYANRGRQFKDPKIKAYIESLWWYMPDHNYIESTDNFTPQDWNYINYDPLREINNTYEDNDE